MRLEGKRALITGAGSGIGRALAREAGRHGMRMMLVGRNRDALEETAALIGAGATVHVVPCDITRADCRELLRAEIGRLFDGALDLLVQNAGAQWAGPVDAVDDEALETMAAVNLVAPMALTRALAGALRAAAPSRVVFIGSMFGEIAFPLFAGYSATKAGLKAYADALRRELKSAGIGVTYAAPRATATAMTARQPHLAGAFATQLDAPGDVARRVMRGVRGDARNVYPGFGERMAALVQAFAPGVIDGALGRQLRRAARRLGPDLKTVQGPTRIRRASSWPHRGEIRAVEAGKERSL